MLETQTQVDLRPNSLFLSSTSPSSTYKQSAAKRSKKLTNFFGSEPPLDISVTDIEKNGLNAILLSRVPLAYFLYQILQEHSCENLFFLLEVEHYESSQFSNIESQRQAAKHICETYLSQNSHFEINVDDRISRETLQKVDDDVTLGEAFQPSKLAILLLLEASFQTFVKTDLFKKMRKDIGKTAGLYTTQGRIGAVNLLKKHLKSMPGMKRSGSASSSSSSNEPSSPSQRRNLLIQHMVQEFCYVMLDIDIKTFDGSTVKSEGNIIGGSSSSSSSSGKKSFWMRS